LARPSAEGPGGAFVGVGDLVAGDALAVGQVRQVRDDLVRADLVLELAVLDRGHGLLVRARAKASWSSRETFHSSATFSAVMPMP
jgi:hypothetical protein